MERLTIDEAIKHAKEVAEKNRASYKNCPAVLETKGYTCEMCAEEHEQLAKWLEKLKEYEQAEEDGLMIRLKLKVGDIVYDNKYGMPCGYKIIGYSFGIEEDHINKTRVENEIVYYFKNSNNCINGSFRSSQIGKVVFLTLEEAEQALAKMKGE